MTELMRTGRVWKFGNNINTDLIFPNSVFRLPKEEQYKLVFSANRPGWVEQAQVGDLLIAGTDFGMGSGRPIGDMLHQCGIRGIVVESINGLGIRNCVNFAMPAMACNGVTDLFEEGQQGEFDFRSGLVKNVTTGKSLQGVPMPPLFLDIVAAGGIIQMLVKKDLIEPAPTFASSK